MPGMGDLARQDQYPDDVDWSRYNQPFGQLQDPNPTVYNTAAMAWEVWPTRAGMDNANRRHRWRNLH